MPMFVGEVREAITGAGCCWKLSGGSQLSSGPTKSAKKRQVRRADVRRNARCCALRSGSRGRNGLLIHQPTTGDSSQDSSTGAQKYHSAGRLCHSTKPSASATTGAIHISRRKSSTLRRALRRA